MITGFYFGKFFLQAGSHVLRIVFIFPNNIFESAEGLIQFFNCLAEAFSQKPGFIALTKSDADTQIILINFGEYPVKVIKRPRNFMRDIDRTPPDKEEHQ